MNKVFIDKKEMKIGEVFTPLIWAEWLIDKSGVFNSWINGASICDPTAGEGIFALALFNIAKKKGLLITEKLLKRLTLVDICESSLDIFKEKAHKNYGVDFPADNLFVQDVILNTPNIKSDILVGNPPWANFTDLALDYKNVLKPYFITEGLVPDKKKVLLGASRVDIAALVLKVVLGKMLNKDGFGYFYLPLSLFSGDDAHAGFRDYKASKKTFHVEEVYEFTDSKVFKEIGTSYCYAKFHIDSEQKFPVKYFREGNQTWDKYFAIPLNNSSDAWRIVKDLKNIDTKIKINISLKKEQQPRQGVNTCGVNSLFIFKEKPTYIEDEYLFPLATKIAWKESSRPGKWILLPYDINTGKPLLWRQIEQMQGLCKYLKSIKKQLISRKGTLIQVSITKGCWWSLLGVGPYSFAPYKVIWEAYGSSNFNPIVLSKYKSKEWQANQAMQAFIPSWDKKNAEDILRMLKQAEISNMLHELNGGGKCNWAQPGKIKKILNFHKKNKQN